MRKFFAVLFGIYALVSLVMLFTTKDITWAMSVAIGLVVGIAAWTDNLDLIPGDAETEAYRLRMMLKEQNRNRRQR